MSDNDLPYYYVRDDEFRRTLKSKLSPEGWRVYQYYENCFDGSGLNKAVKTEFLDRLVEEYPAMEIGDKVGPWIREEKGWVPVKKEEPPAVLHRSQIQHFGIEEFLEGSLATILQPSTPTSLTVRDPGGARWQVQVLKIETGPIVVVFDKKGLQTSYESS